MVETLDQGMRHIRTRPLRFLDGMPKFWLHSLPALLLFGTASVLKVIWHESAPMDWLREQVFLALHPSLPVDQRAELPLVIVDISNLDVESIEGQKIPPEAFKKRSARDYTPCGALSNIVKAVSRAKPIAIGIDIDFSPDFTGTEPPPDLPQFLEYCRSLTIPVYLGVGRAATRPPDSWLAGASHIRMAAGILGFAKGRNIRLPAEIKYKEERALPSLSASLVDEYRKVHNKPHRLAEFAWSWLAGTTEVPLGRETKPFEVKSILVNYQFLSRFQPDSPCVYSADKILWPEGDAKGQEEKRRQQMKDKLILVGDAASPTNPDKANVAGSANPEPGLFVHACAVCTQIEFPLREVGLIKGIFLALGLLLLLLCWEWRMIERYNKPQKISASESVSLSQTAATSALIIDRQVVYSRSSRTPAILVIAAFVHLLVLAIVTWFFAGTFHLLWLDSITVGMAAIAECAILIVYENLKPEK